MTMLPLQRNLLIDLHACGGAWDRYNRILADGRTHNKETVVSCFRKGWIASDGKRVTLTEAGRAIALAEQEAAQ